MDKRRYIFYLFFIFVIASLIINSLSMASLGGERVFIIEEKIQFKGLTNNITNLRIWLPYPANDDWQVVNDFVLSGPLKNNFLFD